MSRGSRFDKLEFERPSSAKEEAPSKDTEHRFERLEQTEPTAPLSAPQPTASRFEEFDEQQALARLPFRRCASCKADSSQWATRCRQCGESLTTPEAIHFNMGVLRELEVPSEAPPEPQPAPVLVPPALEALSAFVAPAQVEKTAPVAKPSGRLRYELIALSVGLFVTMFLVAPYGLKCVLFVAALVALAVGVPTRVWRRRDE